MLATAEIPSPADLELHRRVLVGHCYRMLGSASEADDAVQETMVRAWRHRERYEGRASLRTWMYRIATRVCLDTLSHDKRRVRPTEHGPVGTIDDSLTALPHTSWIEPIPDELALPDDADPHELTVLRQSIRLAFVAALQHLPPKQRAVLLLTEVLGWSAADVADSLDTTIPAVNSALQRARATLASRDVAPTTAALTPEQSALVDRYVDAFERYDIDTLATLLHADATLSMPPFSLWLQGHAPIKAWMLGRGAACRDSRLVPVAASGSPAFGQYKPAEPGVWRAWALIVLEPSGPRFAHMNFFLDVDALFPRFGLPPQLTAEALEKKSSDDR